MPSHLSTLGFRVKTRWGFNNLAKQTVEAGQRVEVPGQGSYRVWMLGQGIELWAQTNQQGRVIGFHPHFKGDATMRVGLTRRVARPADTLLDGAFFGWANPPENDPEQGIYPFAFDIPDYRVYNDLQLPYIFRVSLTAFALEMMVYRNEEAHHAASMLATEACIPSGTFLPEGGPIDPPKSEVIYSGRVLETTLLRNPLTHRSFHWARIRTLGGEVDLVADPKTVFGIPVKGGVIQGRFWLSGRIQSPA
jgi:hypothetical protein